MNRAVLQRKHALHSTPTWGICHAKTWEQSGASVASVATHATRCYKYPSTSGLLRPCLSLDDEKLMDSFISSCTANTRKDSNEANCAFHETFELAWRRIPRHNMSRYTTVETSFFDCI